MIPLFQEIIVLAKKLFQGVYLNLVAAAIIVLIGFIVGKIASKLVYKILRELEIRSVLKQARIHAPVERYVSKGVAYLIYFIAVIMALNQLKIGTLILSIIVGAVLIVLVISFILSIKDFVPNLTAGISLYRAGLIKKGDTIEAHGVAGIVRDITLTKTKVETKEGDLVYIPNAAIIKQGFVKKIKKQHKKRKE